MADVEPKAAIYLLTIICLVAFRFVGPKLLLFAHYREIVRTELGQYKRAYSTDIRYNTSTWHGYYRYGIFDKCKLPMVRMRTLVRKNKVQ